MGRTFYRPIVLAGAGAGAVLCLVLVGGVVAQRARLNDGGRGTVPDRARDSENQTARRRAHLATTLQQFDAVWISRGADAALPVWRDAYIDALGIPRWEAMAAVGDASLLLETLAPTVPYRRHARAAYLNVLIRARDQQSLDGVLRAARGFAVLGDRTVMEHSLQVADSLAGSDRDRRDRVKDFVESLAPGLDARGGPPSANDDASAPSPRLEP